MGEESMSRATEELVKAIVDRERLGDRWRSAIVQLIEAHEQKHDCLVTRKEIHILMGRYAAAYFPGEILTYADRRFVIGLLRERDWYRREKYIKRFLNRRASVPSDDD